VDRVVNGNALDQLVGGDVDDVDQRALTRAVPDACKRARIVVALGCELQEAEVLRVFDRRS
jgi:hypothetical protein